jgi:hypothetical protein
VPVHGCSLVFNRIGASILVANDGSVVVLEPDLPIAVVTTEECDIAAAISEGFDIVPHRFGPVFVMPNAQKEPVSSKKRRVAIQIDAGAEIGSDTVYFKPLEKIVFPPVEVVQSTGPVERDFGGRAGVEWYAIVKALASPGVIGLCCSRGYRKQNFGRGRAAFDNKQHFVGSVVGRQPRNVDAALPTLRNYQRVC